MMMNEKIVGSNFGDTKMSRSCGHMDNLAMPNINFFQVDA